MDELKAKGKKRKSCPDVIELSDDEKTLEISIANDEEPAKKCSKISNLTKADGNAALIDLVSETSNENGSNDSSVQVIENNDSVVELDETVLDSSNMCVVDSTSFCDASPNDCPVNIVPEATVAENKQMSGDSLLPLDNSAMESTPKKKNKKRKKKCKNDSDFIETKASTFMEVKDFTDGSLLVIDKVGDCHSDEEGELVEASKHEVTSSPSITITFKNSTVTHKYRYKFMKFLARFEEFKAVETKHKIELIAKDNLFILDTNPSSHNENNTIYTTKYQVSETQEAEKQGNDRAKLLQSCFNCDGDHSLRDCPVPRDMQRIFKARKQFKSQNNSQSNVRYHVDEDSKYGHLVPGKLSERLRIALGLNADDIPAHVYKMRLAGYPPGWLKEATVAPSNIDIFSDVDNVSKAKKKLQESIDIKKVVEYPGFNVPMERGVFDHFNKYRVPPFSKMCSKTAMIDYFNNQANDDDDQQSCEMEVENLTDDLSQEAASEDSTSLVDLNLQKEQLLTQLSESGETNEDETAGSKDVSLSVVEDEAANSVKASIFGTPILKSASPYSRLPNSDKFSKEISPVINFENLPNSTGTYEKMTGVLSKVRKLLKNVQEQT